MNALLNVLASWQGRRAVESELERRGLQLHRVYQEEIRSYCNLCGGPDDIDQYWDEISKEWVMSAGRGDINTRKFRGDTAYRSAYLDNLYITIDRQRYPFKIPFLHPCLNERRLSLYSGRLGLIDDLNKKIQIQKKLEAERVPINHSGWDGTRSMLNKILGKFAHNKGFADINTRNWNEYVLSSGYQRTVGDLVVECATVRGKYNTLAGSLDLKFRFSHVSDRFILYQDYDFDNVVPGFSYYRLFHTPESVVLGVFALTELVDIFSSLVG